MKIETFTLRSNDTGGVAALRQVHPDCGGQNISPELSWVNAPEGTRSFAITMYDKDAPTGGGFWHWLMFDIPASVGELRPDAGNTFGHLAPVSAVQSLNDYGTYGYGGKHSNKCTFYTLRFGCSFAAVNTIKPQLL